ncbi:MAG: hypothetical protein Q9227_003809 [Pyrenula ochraceoflavens]
MNAPKPLFLASSSPVKMQGYSRIAKLMSKNKELACVRRFASLNMQDLLYYQAELVQLEADYHELALARPSAKNPLGALYDQDWWTLSQSHMDSEHKQWKLWLQIREKLKEYNKALRTQISLGSVAPPAKYDLEIFRYWLEGPDQGNFPLRGPDQHSWSSKHSDDLIALNAPSASDALTSLFKTKFLPAFHNLALSCYNTRRKVLRQKPAAPEDESSSSPADLDAELGFGPGFASYSDRRIHLFFNLLCTLISSLLPISSIIILYSVHSVRARLGIAAAFTASFSLCLAMMTSGRRVEIFAATTAFAAVQVVFISGTS